MGTAETGAVFASSAASSASLQLRCLRDDDGRDALRDGDDAEVRPLVGLPALLLASELPADVRLRRNSLGIVGFRIRLRLMTALISAHLA